MNILIPIILFASTTICTASVQLPTHTSFTYSSHVMVLNVPEYNNETTRTAGFPGCFTGYKLMGWASKKPIGGFTMDKENNFNNLNLKSK